jgi:hypothetical protein
VRRDDVADALVIPPATKSTAGASAIVLGEELARASATSIKVVVQAKHDASSAWSAVADALKMADIAFKEVLADPLGQRAVASDLDVSSFVIAATPRSRLLTERSPLRSTPPRLSSAPLLWPHQSRHG